MPGFTDVGKRGTRGQTLGSQFFKTWASRFAVLCDHQSSVQSLPRFARDQNKTIGKHQLK